MRILVVTPFLPYPGVPHAGGKLVYHLLCVLARSHSVALLSRCFPGEDRHLPALNGMMTDIELVPASGPVRSDSLFSIAQTVRSYRQLARRAAALMDKKKFDLCQVEFTETGVFWRPFSGVPAALTCHDIIAKPAFRRYRSSRGLSGMEAWVSWQAKRLVEERVVRKFQCVFTLSEEDREWGENLYPGVPFRVLRYPGGIDYTGVPREERKNRILFLGALNRRPNIEAVRHLWERIWPIVSREIPGAELRIVGGGLPETLKRDLSRDPRIALPGFVERTEDAYREAAVFAAPILEGGGVIVKILDALAAGVPTVTTPFGNEGIRARDGKEILVADDPASFAASIVRLLRDDALRASVGIAGKRFVELQFSRDALISTLEDTYRDIIIAGKGRVFRRRISETDPPSPPR